MDEDGIDVIVVVDIEFVAEGLEIVSVPDGAREDSPAVAAAGALVLCGCCMPADAARVCAD